MRHTIKYEGIEMPLTPGQAIVLLDEAIREADDAWANEDETVYELNVGDDAAYDAELREHYEARTGPFAVDALLVCRTCGCADEIRAWYDEPTCQGCVGLYVASDDGALTVGFDYDGVSYGHYDSGPNTEYRCSNCDDAAETLEELVGLPRVGERTYKVELTADELNTIQSALYQTSLMLADRSESERDEDDAELLADVDALSTMLVAVATSEAVS